MSIESDIKQKALALGFDAVGITTAAPVEPEQVDFYQQWLKDGCAAKMTYLHHNFDKRFAPAKLLDGAKSVICVALNYRPAKMELTENPNIRIARFAQYEDYHPFIKNRLFQLADYITRFVIPAPEPGSNTKPSGCRVKPGMTRKENLPRADREIRFKACVDSVPLAERALAQRAGLGFIGKNHMLIHPEFGCQILLGELISTLELEPDAPFENQSCGDCGKCIRACPTGALAKDGTFDARKCISYLTIEDGNATVPVAYKYDCGRDARVPNYIFGCDECILACPHEINAPARKNTDFEFHPEWQTLTPRQIFDMTDEDFEKIFSNSGIIRTGLEKLKQNSDFFRDDYI
ncbi:MAG: tRNA epoxyqueuosine(34) reductase QueG [Phycisphaerae bacterium]|nr:tRNA epoxyqueuosine(34) reductase QueG [Phycisphaerae bacterium]